MKGIAKIKGPLRPRVGHDETYEVTEYHKGETNSIVHPETIKWKIFRWVDEKWVEAKGNTKTGRKVTFNFSQRAYGKKILVEAFVYEPEMKSPPGLVVLPVMGTPKIEKLEICNAQGKPLTETPSYGQSIVLKVHTQNMMGKTIKLSFWEKDTMVRPTFDPFYHDPKGNTLLWSGTTKVKNRNGIAEERIMLNLNMAMLANKTLYDKSKHQYYILAEAENTQIDKTLNTNPKTPAKPAEPAKPATPTPPSKPTTPATPKKDEGTSILGDIGIIIKNITGWDPFETDKSDKKVVVDDGKVKNCEERFCIKKGSPKSELIREINIRLAGFGGNVPTDEFTDRTEKMVKQFQRDYMKVAETGKVCGNVLRAIDEFQIKYNYTFEQIKCKCGTCSGFGDNSYKGLYLKKSQIEAYHRYEHPGIHRSLLSSLRSVIFYLEKDGRFSMDKISSGYRCRHHEEYLKKPTTNHMGKALDIHFNDKKGKRTRLTADMNTIRKDIFNKYLGAKWDWKEGNIFNLESEAVGALTWVHYDVREFDSAYLEDKFFTKTLTELNGKPITSLAIQSGNEKTCSCAGGGNKSEPKVNKPAVAGSCEDKFKKVAPIILRHEGGYVNDPDDSGGETNKGITIGTFKQYAKEDLGIEPTSENLKKITDDQATIIYRKRYWEPKGFCKIEDDKVSLMIYDWTITSGGAAKKVQELLIDDFEQKITADGGIGSKTIEAINNVENQDKLLKRIGEIRKEYYTNLAIKDGKHTKNYKFLTGWHNRVDDCLNLKL